MQPPKSSSSGPGWSRWRRTRRSRALIIVTHGTHETPEIQRQNRDFAAAVKATGKPVELSEAPNFNHFEMCESLGNPYRRMDLRRSN